MHILTLDLGTRTGWATQTSGGPVRFGTINLTPERHQGIGWRYAKFKRFLSAIKNHMGNIDLVVYEDVMFMGKNGFRAVQLWGGYEAILTAWCEHHNIAYIAVPVGTWKKTAIGNGHAKKGEIMAKITGMGFAPETQDQADAIGILLHCTRAILPDFDNDRALIA